MREVDEVFDDASGEPSVPAMQGEIDAFIVPTRITGPVTVHELPARLSPARSRILSGTAPVVVAGHELRRSRVLLVADAKFWYGTDQASVEARVSAWCPANTLLEWRSVQPVWVMGDVDTDVSLSVTQDLWTT